MGSNTENISVIGYTSPSDIYTSYTDPFNGVLGELRFTNTEIVYTGEIPVEKIWDDDRALHSEDSVYAVLYLDDVLWLDDEGRAQVVKLDAANNWKGAFTVVLADKDDKTENYNYTVKEVSKVSVTELHNWQKAVLANDGTTVIYYEKAVQDGGYVGVNDRGYVAMYHPDGSGGWIIENYHTAILPETGGIGTDIFRLSGMGLISICLLIYGIRRKKAHRREAQ